MLFEWFILFMINTLWKIQSLISCVCKISKNKVLKWDVTDLSIILTKFGVYWNISNYSLFFMVNCNCNLYRFSLLDGRLFFIEWCRNTNCMIWKTYPMGDIHLIWGVYMWKNKNLPPFVQLYYLISGFSRMHISSAMFARVSKSWKMQSCKFCTIFQIG